MRGFIGVAGGLVDDFAQCALERGAFEADRGGLDGEGLGTKGLDLKAVALEFPGDARKYNHLLGLEFDEQGHEQALALDFFDLAGGQDFFKENALVGDVLIDDPEAVFSGGKDEGLAELAERLQVAQMVEVSFRLFGLDPGCAEGRIGRGGGENGVKNRIEKGCGGKAESLVFGAEGSGGIEGQAAWSRSGDLRGELKGLGLGVGAVTC